MLWLIALLLLGWALAQSQYLEILQPQKINSLLSENNLLNVAGFVAAAALMTAVGLPRQLPAFLAGFIFDIYTAVLLTAAAATLGAWSGYMLARYLIKGPFIKKLVDKNQRITSLFKQHTFSTVLAVRLFPVGNNLLVNLLSGAAVIPLAPFLAASFVGYLPQTLIFSLSGAGLQTGTYQKILLGLVLFIISTLVGIRLYRRSGRLAITPPESDPQQQTESIHGSG
ncbi:hypothetical protein AT746_11750 [Lacimicrobium alkaliphilum]|uniref:TVP38/TMEM64 family membrane protein n=1 Tax=Lacimicrobium alkaliphilum TaxID=1526571 RepID=A0A0U3ACV4_9ALTE|nr:hypothetical protein AT746_11750 [Lacimicrobium alkaliphilum]